jgi:hypothetical protein
MALCAPIRHAVSWQKAVRAVSGEDILEEVTSDWTGIFLGCSSSVEEEGSGAGKHVSALTGAEGW